MVMLMSLNNITCGHHRQSDHPHHHNHHRHPPILQSFKFRHLPQASLVRTPMHHYVKQPRSRKEVKLARLANIAFNCDAETL